MSHLLMCGFKLILHLTSSILRFPADGSLATLMSSKQSVKNFAVMPPNEIGDNQIKTQNGESSSKRHKTVPKV